MWGQLKNKGRWRIFFWVEGSVWYGVSLPVGGLIIVFSTVYS